MQGENKRKTGTFYEEMAARYLESKGYKILDRNYHCRAAELDLIALDGECLCFVEVKYRKNAAYEAPRGVVTNAKMKKTVWEPVFIAWNMVSVNGIPCVLMW